MLVANKIDQYGDRMVFVEDGQRRYREIGCVGFREISVRESIEQVKYTRTQYAHLYFYTLLRLYYGLVCELTRIYFPFFRLISYTGLGCFP